MKDVYVSDENTLPEFCEEMLKRFMKRGLGRSRREVASKWFEEELYDSMESSGMLDEQC